MSSPTTLLVVVACAALLQVGCEARQHNYPRNKGYTAYRRNVNDAAVALGHIRGSDIKVLPEVVFSGPDVIIGFPNNCRREGKNLLGTLVKVSNFHGGAPPQLKPDDSNDAQSNVAIHCVETGGLPTGCPGGISVHSYQFCGPPDSQSPPPTTVEG